MRRSLVQNLVPEATTIFVVRSYLKCISTTATSTSHLTDARTYVPTYVGLVGYAAVGGM